MMKKTTKIQIYKKFAKTDDDEVIRLLEAQYDAERVMNGLAFVHNLKTHSERKGLIISNPSTKKAFKLKLNQLLKLNENIHVYLSNMQDSIE